MLFQIATLVLATAPVLAYTAAFEVTVKDGYFYRFPGAAVNGTNAGGNGQVKSGESQTFYTEQDGVPEFRDFVLSKGYEVYSCRIDGAVVEGIPLRERPVLTFGINHYCQSAGGLSVSCDGIC